jgi:hypothetical protein
MLLRALPVFHAPLTVYFPPIHVNCKAASGTAANTYLVEETRGCNLA